MNSKTILSRLLSVVILSLLVFADCASSNGPLPQAAGHETRIEAPTDGPIVLICQIDTLSSDHGMTLLSYALAPLIRRDLLCVKHLEVVPTDYTFTPSKSYFLTETGIRRFATAHGADIIALGLLGGDAEKISVDFKAYDIKNNRVVIKKKFEDEPLRFYDLQRTIVYEFVDAMGIKLSGEERDRIKSCSPKKLQAALSFGDGLRCEERESNSDALFSYQKAMGDDKSIAVPYFAEARVFRKMGIPAKSMKSLEEAVERDRFFAEAWYQLSLHAAEDMHDSELAIKHCSQALEIAPRFGKARLSLGSYLHASGDITRAIEETRLAVNLLRMDPLPSHNLGLYSLERGNTEDARFWFEQAIKISPQFQAAQTELKKLTGK
jgi:tetratricopeptide (TPR) repeat protein